VSPVPRLSAALTALALAGLGLARGADADDRPRTSAEVLEATSADDWRSPDPENTLYLEVGTGRVVVELAPTFAPKHAARMKALTRKGYYDGLTIIRVQENYVVQGADGEDADEAAAGGPIAAEFTRRGLDGLAFTPIPGPDGYAPETGFSDGFPAARRTATDEAWLVHCPAAFAMPRGNEPDSGSNGFYVVIGHAPRHLDRNTTVFGRVLWGMSHLTTLPRGTGSMGFYETPEERQPIRSIRVAADVPETERLALEVLRTDTETFGAYLESRRNRREAWFHEPLGYVDVCNVPLPVRETETGD
jgi:peptidylprolyl isomerase